MESMQAVERLASAAAEEAEPLVERVLAEVSVRVPEYQRALVAAGEDPRAVCAGTVLLLLGALADHDLIPLAAPNIRRAGRTRCAAGVALDGMLEALALEKELVGRELEERARAAGSPAEVVLLAERRLDQVASGVTSALARGYMDALRERTREEQRSLAAVVDVAAAVNRSLDVAEVAQAGLASISSAVGADAALLWVVRDGDDELVLAYTSGLRWDEDGALRDSPPAAIALLMRARQAGAPVRGPLLVGTRTVLTSALGVGLRSRGDLVGVMVAGVREPREFSWSEQGLLAAGADHLTAALIRAEKHRREARTDALTGLSNRQEFERQVERAVSGAQRHRRPLALALVDLDGLKEINDRWGHAAGDRALKSVAQALLSAVRATDICARVGGDEFALAMPDSTVEHATEVIKRVQQAVERIHAADFEARLRLSAGVAGWKPGMPWPELFKVADARLYREKRRHHRERRGV
ncbi:MAG TPA: sensor domain-containing diguanylate cyclase [Candidatus Dormibacteraeota bacterium]